MSDLDAFLSTVAAVIGEERLSEEVEQKLRGTIACYL